MIEAVILHRYITGLLYLLFFVSGAAALMYEVTWVRLLTPVFGTSHLAVTTVIGVFMAGLALGSVIIGRALKTVTTPLRLYGLLELGIAASALAGAGMMHCYPALYVPLAHLGETSNIYLTILRISFAVLALIVPTSLMGGTLPTLAALVTQGGRQIGMKISLLYGINTIGAVVGAGATGFLLLPRLHVSGTLALAIVLNAVIGAVCLLLQKTLLHQTVDVWPEESAEEEAILCSDEDHGADMKRPLQLVFWGAGVSGFCALGYEVLWTRMLSMVLGASVYGFTLILVAFLAGLGLGGCAWGIVRRKSLFANADGDRSTRNLVITFAVLLMFIGVSAFLVTATMAKLPGYTIQLQKFFLGKDIDLFLGRSWASAIVSFSYLFPPAMLLGVAFPLAAELHARGKRSVGTAVGEILAVNTCGAIAGAIVSGYALLYLVGLERSLQLLALINLGFGAVICAAVAGGKKRILGAATIIVAILAVAAAYPNAFRFWNQAYLAIYRSGEFGAFSSSERAERVVQRTAVLYYGEGTEATVSSIFAGGVQTFLINGRPEASTSPGDMQNQYALGHLPMLLARKTESVFVLGVGSGMTLGSILTHPGVERVTVAELEPNVVGVAKTFRRYNHNALASPKVRLVFNDGRNYLLSTRDRFDVITADPVHPWLSGASYLYTSEYYQLAAERLNPGGVMCQWLPFYELQERDLQSVVRTFRQHFRHAMAWLTHNDVILIGSNSPIVISEAEMARRMSVPEVASDLGEVMMGTPGDLFSFFLMGDRGMEAFGRNGIINSDDNLFLEFSAPRSISDNSLMRDNLTALSRFRESIVPYLDRTDAAGGERDRRWGWLLDAGQQVDLAHSHFLGRSQEFMTDIQRLDRMFPAHGRWKFMRREYSRITGNQL